MGKTKATATTSQDLISDVFEEVAAQTTKRNDEVIEEVKETEETKSVSVDMKSALASVKTTFKGFFTVATVIAIVVTFILFKTKNPGVLTIDLPTLNISYTGLAILAAIIFAIGTFLTSRKTK